MTDETEEALLERFVAAYSVARERSARYWRQWMKALGPLPRQVVEGMAADLAESAQIPLEEAQARLAAEKVAADMGGDWVRDWLAENELRRRDRMWQAQRPLQPLVVKKKKR